MLGISKYSLLVYLLLKPFYIFSSGGLQVADLFLLISFICVCVAATLNEKNRKIVQRILGENKLFIVFVLCTFLINGFYFTYYPEQKFIMSSLYYVFNFLAIVTFTANLGDKKFIEKMGKIFKFNLLLQLVIWAVDLGRNYDATRYMGTFNDPNQFGYYVLLSLLFIFIIDVILSKKYTYLWYAVVLFLIYLSSSTGMLLGLAIFSVLFVIYYVIAQRGKSYALVQKVMYSLAAIVLIASPLVLVMYPNHQSGGEQREISPIVERAEEKLQKGEGNGDMSLWEDRGLDTVYKYPQYAIIGSGQGAYHRFVGATNNYGGEIHSTLPSILFYYGLIPTLLLLSWLLRYVRGVSAAGWVALLPLFAVSFILLNQRQAMFWVLIILVGLFMNSKRRNFKNELEGAV